jgi:ribosomal protein L11 methyltransferase
MFLWRKLVDPRWVKVHEKLLKAHAHGQLVIVEKPGRKRLGLEIVCRSRSDSAVLIKKFGGRIEPLPRNWLERFARADSKPLKIGKRLVISSAIEEMQRCSVRCPQRSSDDRTQTHALRTAHFTGRHRKALLIIPASMAFGTGKHVTTAMSLRLLEELTRGWKPGWSLVDLGTGSGILALAAKRLGAGHVTGIDNDPTAIWVAKSNVRLNKITSASFQLGDVRKWNAAGKIDVITANLYSDLLVDILPKLGGSRWLILSGVLRSQQDELACALRENQHTIINVRRRGKWVAILASSSGTPQPVGVGPASFAAVTDRRYSKN